jgi:hypothetical protein
MFRAPIVDIFREVFFGGCFTLKIKTIYKYKMLSFK